MHGWRTASYTRTRCGSGARTWTRDVLNEAVTAYELVFRSNQGDKVRVFYTRGKFQKLSHLVRLLKRSRMQAIHPSRMQSAPSPGHTRSWSVEIPNSPSSDCRSSGLEHRRSLSGGSAPLGFQSPYALMPEQSAKFDAVFEAHSEGGVMTGARVRDCLMKSELPKEELSTVWGLCKSEANLSPNLGKFEFRVAMHLVTLRLQGVPLPHTLPACLQQQRDGDPSAVLPTPHSVDWGAVMASSPRPGSLPASPPHWGNPRQPSVDWAAGLSLPDPLSRSFPGMPLSRQPNQVPTQAGERQKSFRAANPFRRQESGSLREEPEGDGQRRCCG